MDRNQIQISFLWLLPFMMAACAHAPSATNRVPASESKSSPIADLPNQSALKQWQEVAGYRTGEKNLDSFEHVNLDCADQQLYPLTPQEETKVYHRFNSSMYDEKKLIAGDYACRIGSKYKNAKGVKVCLAANIAYDVVLSDVFADSCGHKFRGFWEVAYLKTDETMGTLISHGRTLYPRPGSEFENDVVIGGTYAVPMSDLMFLSPLFPEDAEKIERLTKQAIQAGVTWNEKTHLFEQKP